MSITETEAKRICRQSGAYCEREAPNSHRYTFAIAAKSISGYFEVEDDCLIKIEYGFNDPFTGQHWSYKKQTFNNAESWAAFWADLHNHEGPEELVVSIFNPSNDDLCKTESERKEMVRVGQNLYRMRLEKLWNSACAVTGIQQQELLRASHAKAWAECTSGAERLNPYNGFLLNVALDALFDKHLISFNESGQILISSELDPDELFKLGINKDLRLRVVHPQNLPFLAWHRKIFDEIQNSKENAS